MQFFRSNEKWQRGELLDGANTLMSTSTTISLTEVATHASRGDYWIALHGLVYDVSNFLDSHPGGRQPLLAVCGTDATEAFNAFHSRALLDGALASSICVGRLAVSEAVQHGDTQSLQSKWAGDGRGDFEIERLAPQALAGLQNLLELEQEARKRLPPSLDLYIAYGAEDEDSLRANRAGFQSFSLRPRVLCDVSKPSLATVVAGCKVDFPIGIAPFAAARTTHPDGERALALAAAASGCAFTVPHYGGYPLGELAGLGATLFFQLYPPRVATNSGEDRLDRAYLEGCCEFLRRNGVRAVLVTCDVAVHGNRERTYKNSEWVRSLQRECGGFAQPRALDGADLVPHAGHASSLTWPDMEWLGTVVHSHGMKIFVKGVMHAEDAAMAARCGMDGIVVSNHGGRQLDGTDATIEVLEECVDAVRSVPECEVWLDGGVRRGKDVFKALALGAKCVFVGRPALHGLALGGRYGVERTLELLRDELTTVMQLCGCSSVEDISREHVRDRRHQSARL